MLCEERGRHIAGRHLDLWPGGMEYIAATLGDPDQVRRSVRFGFARLFPRWYDGISKHVVVVVIGEAGGRYWVVTAYIARKLAPRKVEWNRIWACGSTVKRAFNTSIAANPTQVNSPKN